MRIRRHSYNKKDCTRRSFLSLAAMVMFTCCSYLSTVAQTAASIQGTVVDQQGGAVRLAQVLLQSRGGTRLLTTTDSTGSFAFNNLKAGEYLSEVRAEGFAIFSSDPVSIQQGEARRVQFVLRVAAINENVVITGTGTPQRADEVAKVLTLVDSQEIESRHELGIAEALRGTPGVRVQQQGSPGALTTVRLRGLRNFDTAILLDGLRVRDASDINGSAVSLITDLVPVAIDRLEVLRGSGSSIYGTNAIGGVINIVPASGGDRFHSEVGFEGGGLRTFREHLQNSGGGNRIAYAIGLSRLDIRRGVDGNDEYGNTGGGGRLSFTLSPSINVSGSLYGTISNARQNDSPFALPAAFISGKSFSRARPGFTFQPDFNNPDQGRRNRLLVGSIRFTQQINEALSYALAYQHVSSHRRNYNGTEIDPQFISFYPFGDFAFTNTNRGITDTLDARLNTRLARSNLLTAGFEFEQESIFQQSLPSFSAFNNTTDRQRTFGLFGQDQLSLLAERLQISLAIRGQFYRVRPADRPDFLSAFKPERSVTGDGAIAYYFRSTGTKLRGHIGNGFRAPSLFERFGVGTFPTIGFVRFGDPTLKAEQSLSLDAGVDQRAAHNRVLLGITYFYTRLQRVIAFSGFTTDPLGVGRFSGYVNQSGGLARGIETCAETTPFRGTEIRSSYSYTNSDRSRSPRGLQPEYVIPAHLFSFSVNQHYRSFALSLDLNRTGSYIAPVFENDFPFRTAELTFPGYTKVDIFGSYNHALSEHLTALLFAGAENLLNQTYYENGFRAPGIVGRVGIKLRF